MAEETVNTGSSDYKGSELIPPKGHKDVGKRVFIILSEIIQDKINQGLHEKWISS